MNDFNTLFPNFANQCAEMNRVLLPAAFVLLVIGIVSSTITGQRSPGAYLRTFGRTLAFLAVLSQLTIWGNQVTGIVDNTVKNTLKADPAGVYQQYQKTLEVQRGSASSKSWWDKLFDGQAVFETLISFVLYFFGFLASVIVFYAYLVQKFVLYLGYALSPIFISFLAVRTLQSIGTSYLLGLAGVMLWPLGWGAAAIMTQGLLDFMADQSFLSFGGVGGAAGYTLQNLIGVAVLGIWLIFSTIAAPVIVQKAIATGAQIGSALAAGAATAGTAAATTGAATAATIGGGGGAMATAGGLAGGAVAGGTALAGSSMSGSPYSPGGGLLSSVTSQRGPKRPAKDDLSGDEAVRELLGKHGRN
ncbi:MAG TPA: hypothetical protein VIS71_07850 [Terrimicrobium sp.]